MTLSVVHMPTSQILVGDVLQKIQEIPDSSVDCVITSVPFFGVRDYKVSGQWGLEKDLGTYLDRMNQLMAKLYRILKPTGSVWIEIGDKRDHNGWLGIPEEFATNQRRRGWGIISKPIWYKRNAMPLSSKRMFSPKYTNIYGFSKSEKFYFDVNAVKIPAITKSSKPFNVRVRDDTKPKFLQKASRKEKSQRQSETPGPDGDPLGHYAGFNDRYDHEKILKSGKNPGDYLDFEEPIFDITVKPFKGLDHYATFPKELPERIIKACSPVGGVVLDCFIGSGTVGVVCENLKRKWIGIELKREFAEFALNRIGKEISQQPKEENKN